MIFRAIKNSILSIGKKLDEPFFPEEFKNQSDVIEELEKIKSLITNKKIVEYIDRDIVFIKKGEIGEKRVYFELENSFMPMICLHDITITHKNKTAQMDFILITQSYICILETKQLNGDIEVRNNGDFIRYIKRNDGSLIKKEGMYSPVTQNERHVEILKSFLLDNKMIKNTQVLSKVVIANPKAVVNMKYAKKELKQKIIKCDQIIANLKALNNQIDDICMPYKTLFEISDFILENRVEKQNTFADKYKKYINKTCNYDENIAEGVIKEESEGYEIEKEDEINLKEKLRRYRLDISRKEEVKPYFVFSNKTLEELVDVKPKSISELLKISGFGEVKAGKYGEEIIKIISE